MGIFDDFAETINALKFRTPKLTSRLDEGVICSINNGELVNLQVDESLILAPGEKCHYADEAYKYNGKKGFLNYDYIIGTLYITSRRIIFAATGGFDFPFYSLTVATEYDDGILFQFGERLIAMGIPTAKQAYRVIQILKNRK